MEQEARRFTVEEANALLSSLEPILHRIRKARQVVLKGGERIRESAMTDGGGKQDKAYWRALESLRRDLEEVTGQGIILRDPETGLIDFPTMREGREVFLCWRLGEDAVAFWHGPESGFSGRRPL